MTQSAIEERRSPKGGETRAPAPNFLVVGAAKSGTTSLYHFLNQHPAIFLSPARKEGRFFSGVGDGSVYWPRYYHFDTAADAADYASLFERWDGQARIGDVSPDYLAYSHRAAPRVEEICGPETRIIAILRDPSRRAYSHYLQNVRRDAEFFSFEKTLEIEAARKADGWGFQWLYTDTGRFADKLTPYLDRFENVLVLTQDALGADPAGTMAQAFDFLGLESIALKPQQKFNAGGVPADKAAILDGAHDDRSAEAFEDLHAELIAPAAASAAAPASDGVYPPLGAAPLLYPEMKPDTLARLDALFAPQIEALEARLGRTFPAWRGDR